MSRLNSCSPDTSLEKAATIMRNTGRSALLVITREGKAAGTISDKDLVDHVVADGVSARVPVEQVMNRHVETIPVDYRLSDIMEKLPLCDLERIIIVDEDERPVGLLRHADLYGLLGQEFAFLANSGCSAFSEKDRGEQAA